jgi:hypothetical protein
MPTVSLSDDDDWDPFNQPSALSQYNPGLTLGQPTGAPPASGYIAPYNQSWSERLRGGIQDGAPEVEQ